jgi:hypothetical protein
LSYGEGITLVDGDVVAIEFEGFGRALRNTVRIEPSDEQLVSVAPLG